MSVSHEELRYLLHRANALGIQGQYIHDVILPTKATQSISDTLWVTQSTVELMTTSNAPPWEK